MTTRLFAQRLPCVDPPTLPSRERPKPTPRRPVAMTLSRSTSYSLFLVAVAALWLSSARADEPKETPPAPKVPALPDFSKDVKLPEVFAKPTPEGIDDLKAIEKHV